MATESWRTSAPCSAPPGMHQLSPGSISRASPAITRRILPLTRYPVCSCGCACRGSRLPFFIRNSVMRVFPPYTSVLRSMPSTAGRYPSMPLFPNMLFSLSRTSLPGIVRENSSGLLYRNRHPMVPVVGEDLECRPVLGLQHINRADRPVFEAQRAHRDL